MKMRVTAMRVRVCIAVTVVEVIRIKGSITVVMQEVVNNIVIRVGVVEVEREKARVVAAVIMEVKVKVKQVIMIRCLKLILIRIQVKSGWVIEAVAYRVTMRVTLECDMEGEVAILLKKVVAVVMLLVADVKMTIEEAVVCGIVSM